MKRTARNANLDQVDRDLSALKITLRTLGIWFSAKRTNQALIRPLQKLPTSWRSAAAVWNDSSMRTFKSVHWKKSTFNNLRTRTLKNVFTNHLVWLKYSRERNWRRYSVMKGYIRWSSSTMRKTMSIMYQKEHWRKMFRIKGCTVSKVVFHKRWRFRWRFQLPEKCQFCL